LPNTGARGAIIARSAEAGPLAKATRLSGTLSTLRYKTKDRDDACEEMDYYTNKVAKLHIKQAKGVETPKETEKRLRNEKKLALLQQYTTLIIELLFD
jgi:FMN-dependent NADH-azoreductase